MTSVILAGWCAVAAAALFRGISCELSCLLPLAVAAGASTGTVLFPVLVLFFSLGLVSPEALPWAVLTAGAVSAVAGKSPVARVFGFVSVAWVLWFIPVQFSVPVLVTAAFGAFFHRRKPVIYGVSVLAFLLSAAVFGLPRMAAERCETARSYTREGVTEYAPAHIYTWNREICLPAPVSGTWAMWVYLDSGGVRDTLPMTSLCLGEEMIFLPAGKDTICFTFEPGDTLRVRLMRDSEPFLHPVIHVFAGGERV